MLTFNFKKLSLNHDIKILDIGCGEGRHIFGALEAFMATDEMVSWDKENGCVDTLYSMDAVKEIQ